MKNEKLLNINNDRDNIFLIRNGYFNLINGYKFPFIIKKDKTTGKHEYHKNIDLANIYCLKKFDEDIRTIFLEKLRLIENEIRVIFSQLFSDYLHNNRLEWDNKKTYRNDIKLKYLNKMISSSLNQLNKSNVKYVEWYYDNHNIIPPWIMCKTINFSTFIDIVSSADRSIQKSLCNLYNIPKYEPENSENTIKRIKNFISLIQTIRVARNICAHNERIYDFNMQNSGRIKSTF